MALIPILRASYKLKRKKESNYTQRDINIENIRPRKMISDPASDSRTQCRPDDHTQPINGLSHSSFFRRITFCYYSLRSYQQSPATDTLEKAEGYQLPNAGRIST